jgi:hypothetical protein
MTQTDVDPSLCTGEPTLDRLDDGFSPPPQDGAEPPATAVPELPAEQLLGTQSAF